MTHMDPITFDPKHYSQHFDAEHVYHTSIPSNASGALRHARSDALPDDICSNPELCVAEFGESNECCESEFFCRNDDSCILSTNSTSTRVRKNGTIGRRHASGETCHYGGIEHYVAVAYFDVDKEERLTLRDPIRLAPSNGVQLGTEDCSFVLTDSNNNVLWQSNQPNAALGCRMVVQADGNLVVNGVENNIVWASNTNSIKLLKLDNGKLRGYDEDDNEVWFSHFTAEELTIALFDINWQQQPTLDNLNGVSDGNGVQLQTEDCALVLMDSSSNLLWQSNAPNAGGQRQRKSYTQTSASASCRIELQDDGNLVVYNVQKDEVVWASNTNSITLLKLDNGKLRGYDEDDNEIWFSHFTAEELTIALFDINWQQQPTLDNLNGVSDGNGVQLQTEDCALVLMDSSSNLLWQSNAPNTNASASCRIELQDDGNLVIYDEQNDVVVWASNTDSIQLLKLEDDGILRGYDSDNNEVWFSHSVNVSPNVAGQISTITNPKRRSMNFQKETTDKGVQLQTEDCALVLMDSSSNLLWQSNAPNTNASASCRIELQDDGNLVIYDEQNDVVVWASKTDSIQLLKLEDDGILRGYDSDNNEVWFSHYSELELAESERDAIESIERANHFLQQKDEATPRFLPHLSRINPTQTKEDAMGWKRTIYCHGTNADITYVHVYKAGGSAVEQLSDECQQTSLRNNFVINPDTGKASAMAKKFGAVNGMLATFVRDPIDRFCSAVAEIYASGHLWKWNPDPDHPEKWVGEMIASIQREKWLWNAHTTPQNVVLRHNNGTKLPMAFVGSTGSFNRDLKALYAKTGALHTPTFKVVHGPEQAKHAETLRGKKELICRKISQDDLLFLCKMYYEDYIAFDLTPPNECRSLFASKEESRESELDKFDRDLQRPHTHTSHHNILD